MVGDLLLEKMVYLLMNDVHQIVGDVIQTLKFVLNVLIVLDWSKTKMVFDQQNADHVQIIATSVTIIIANAINAILAMDLFITIIVIILVFVANVQLIVKIASLITHGATHVEVDIDMLSMEKVK